MRVLVYRIQAAAFGDLDRTILRRLRDDALELGDARPFAPRGPTTREGVGLKSGALLVREWSGRLERVMVLDDGYAWNGCVLASCPLPCFAAIFVAARRSQMRLRKPTCAIIDQVRITREGNDAITVPRCARFRRAPFDYPLPCDLGPNCGGARRSGASYSITAQPAADARRGSSRPFRRRSSLCLPVRQPQNDVAVALARPAHRAEPIHHRGLNPDQALTPLVGLALVAHAAERERPGNRLERLDADGDADHGAHQSSGGGGGGGAAPQSAATSA